jgi:hypothetical protein
MVQCSGIATAPRPAQPRKPRSGSFDLPPTAVADIDFSIEVVAFPLLSIRKAATTLNWLVLSDLEQPSTVKTDLEPH